MRSRLYYFVDHVARFEGNHGIHQVSRLIARALMDDGRDVVFLSWLADQQRFTRTCDADLRLLARWGGPPYRPQGGSGLPLDEDPADREQLAGSWLLVPELPYHVDKHPDTTGRLIARAHEAGMRIAFVLHDLIPIRVKGYGSIKPLHVRHLTHLTAADLIIPISRHSAEDLRRYYASRSWPRRPKLPSIEPLLLPDEAAWLPRGASATATTPGAPLEMLCVGAIEPRKNHRRLLQGFDRFVRKRPEIDCRLTLVGDHHERTLRRLQPLLRRNPRVRFLGRVDEGELASLYEACDFTIFPSLDEGYGLPIIESLWLGKPVICANFGAMAEVAAGGGCLTVDTRRAGAIERAIESLVRDEDLRAQLAKAARERPARSWRGFSRDLMRLFEGGAIRQALYWVDFTVRHPVNTGVQRVTRQLARALQDRGVGLSFVTWNYEAGRFDAPDKDQLRHLSRWGGPASCKPPAKGAPPTWLIVPEILSPPQPSPAFAIAEARRLGLKSAFLFYDLIPLKRRDDYAPEFVEGFASCWRAMSQADLILPISGASSEDLNHFLVRELGWTPSQACARIRPVPLAGAFATTPRETQAREMSPQRVSIVCVGAIEPRKNQLRLIEALAPLLGEGSSISLTIAGASHAFPALAAELCGRVARLPQARYLDAPSDEVLADLYSASDFTVYASEDEGFGLPVLESLWRGRPCVCHNAGALAEVASGGGCLLVDMRSASALRDGVAQLTSDAPLYRRLAAEAIARPIRGWDDYARDVERFLALG
jgi:glycosyltransferase involved in cell wall biosynthesis